MSQQTTGMPNVSVETARLASVIEKNLAEYQIAMANVFGCGEVSEERHFTRVTTSKPFNEYNGIYRASLETRQIDETISDIMRTFEQRGVPMCWYIGPSTRPSNLADHLLQHGFTHYEDEPGMALQISAMNEAFPQPSGFEVIRVRDTAQLNDWVSIWAYDVPENVLRSLQQIHHELGVEEEKPWRYYVGLLDGKPVATSLLFMGSDACAVHWVVTVPDARKQGIGAVMTIAALREARDMGYDVAILTASPFGAGIYRRIGFQEYCTISKYSWKP